MAKRLSLPLELTIISGESLLTAGRKPVKKNVFAVIKIESFDDQATTIDTKNGSYPLWNNKFFIDMPLHVKFITLEVHYKRFSGDRILGSARVPVTDFSGGYFPANFLHHLSYRLRDKEGERNGIINLSVKVKSPENFSGGVTSGVGVVVGEKVSGGVVMGVPVRNRYLTI